MSKAFGIPGIRVGWIISAAPGLLDKFHGARDYTTITVSQLDDGVAAFALSDAVLPALMKRNLGICRESIAALTEFVAGSGGRVSWTPPAGAGTAWVRIHERDGTPVDDRKFAEGLAGTKRVGIVPGGSCFEDGEDESLRGYFRIALGDAELLKKGLEVLGNYLKEA
jgi:aspartate/methionine/tyrosine aminotransferase